LTIYLAYDLFGVWRTSKDEAHEGQAKPQEAPKVEKVSRHIVVLEKGEDCKNMLNITAISAKHLSKQQQDEAAAVLQRPAKPVLTLATQQNWLGRVQEPARPVQAVPTDRVSMCLCTYVPKRPKIGTWKSNEEKNKGKVVKHQCTFDRLMSKCKKQKVDSMSWPLKKESLHLLSKKIHPR
jgi:hypothetical protein